MLRFLVLTLVLTITHAQSNSVEDYLTATLSVLGLTLPPETILDGCACLTGAINNNSCPAICDSVGCVDTVTEIKACTSAHCPANGLCALGLSTVVPEDNCPTLGAVFAPNTSICANSTISSFIGVLDLEADMRVACQAVNEFINNTESCQNICLNEPVTCADYLGELSVCAKSARDRGCYDAILALRTQIVEQNLNCQNFNELSGACEVLLTADGVVNYAAMTFDNLLPLDFGVVLSGQFANDCACLIENIGDCTICSATDQCNAIQLMFECANETSACSTTNCAASLSQLYDFTTNTSCFQVEAGVYNCSDYGFAPLDCGTWHEESECEALVDQVIARKPVFSNLPTPSQTPSSAVTPSTTGSNQATPSQSPSMAASPSEGSSSPAPTMPVSMSLISVCFALWFALFA